MKTVEKIEDIKFEDLLTNKFLPFVEELIRKEKEHIKWLNKKLDEHENSWFSWIYSDPNVSSYIKECIERSENMLFHYEKRLREYKEYIKK